MKALPQSSRHCLQPGARCLSPRRAAMACAVQREGPAAAEATSSEDAAPPLSNVRSPSTMDVPATSVLLGQARQQENPVAGLLGAIDWSEPISFDGEEKTEYDPLRDGPLRYLGYANELGEAFAAWLFVGGVPLSYGVAISYVLFDTWDKYNKTLVDAREKLTARQDIPVWLDRSKLINAIALERGLDTVVWQLIASVAAPGYTIHMIVAIATGLLEQGERNEAATLGLFHLAAVLGLSGDDLIATLNKSIPTAVGLLAIPFIVHPIDSGVHALLNATLRPAMRRLICKEAHGIEAGLRICQCEECQ